MLLGAERILYKKVTDSTAGQRRIETSELLTVPIPIAPEHEQSLIGSFVSGLTQSLEHFREKIVVPRPCLAEPIRLVERIHSLAAKIEEAKRLRKETEGTKRIMSHAVFSQLNQAVPLKPMVEIAPLARRPVRPKAGELYYELGIRSFGKGSFHKPSIEGAAVGTKKLYAIHPGDLVFNNVFAWEGAVAVAKPEDQGRVGSHRFITCVPKAGIVTAEFLNFYFTTRAGLEYLGQASPGGAGRNRTLGLNALSKIQVPVPDYAKQVWFGQLLSGVDRLTREQVESAKDLDAMLPGILDQAFRGEL